MDGPSEEDGQQSHYPPESEAVCCQVNGCENPVPTKVYYMRHKICSFHASLPGLTLDGQSVRWCQQCARFQPIEDFDGSRKTCWKALAQHNERRRKRGATGGRGSSRTRASPKSSSCTESPGALGAGEGSPWAGDGGGEGVAAPGGSSGAEQTRVVPGRGRRAAAAAALAHFGACTDYEEEESEEETVQDGASRSAVGGKPSKLGRRSGGGGDISSGMAGQLSADFELQEVLGWHARGASAAQAPASVGGEGSGAEGATRAPSLPLGLEVLRGLSEVSLPSNQGPAGKHQPRIDARLGAASPLPAGLQLGQRPQQQGQGQQQQQQQQVEGEDGPWQLRGSVAALGAPFAGPFAGMEQALSREREEQESLVRLSLKLFNVAPDQLAPGVKEQVLALVTQDPAFVDSFVRPGCTHLTVVTIVSPAERDLLRATGAAGLAEQILRRSGWGAEEQQGQAGPGWSKDMLVQLDADVAVVRSGKVAAVVGAEAAAPKLVAARPVAMLASGYQREGTAAGGAPDSSLPPAGPKGLKEGFISLWGYNIGGSHDMVVCRQQGRVLDVEILARGKLPPNTLPSLPSQTHTPEWVLVRPLGVRVGLLQFEVQRGGVLSAAVSMVALPNMAAVVEARRAQAALAGTWDGRYFAQHLGLVLEAAGPWPLTALGGMPTLVTDSASSIPVGCTGRSNSISSPAASLEPQPPQLHPQLAKLASHLLGLAHQHGWDSLAALLERVAGQEGEVHSPVAAAAAAAAAGPEPELPAAEDQAAAQQVQQAKQAQRRGEGGGELCHVGKELASHSASLDINTPFPSAEVASHAARPSSIAERTTADAAAAVQAASSSSSLSPTTSSSGGGSPAAHAEPAVASWEPELRGWYSNSESDGEEDEVPSGSASPRHDESDESDDDSLATPPRDGGTAARKWHSQVLEQLGRGCPKPKLPSVALLPRGQLMASVAAVASVVALRVLLGEA